MKKLIFLMLVLFVVSSVQAGTINFSGRDWTTRDGGGNAYGTAPSYVVNDAQSATATGAWSDAAMMFTELSLSVGDTVSYDWTTTKELRDLSGAVPGGSGYIEDISTGFMSNVVDIEAFSYVWQARDIYYDDGPFDYSYVWTVTSATTLQLDVTDNATSTTTTTTDITVDVAAITHFAGASWNTEQDYTISNFVHFTAFPNNPDPYTGENPVETDLSNRTVSGAVSWLPPNDPNIVSISGYNIYIDPNETNVLNATEATTGLAYKGIDVAGTSFSPGSSLDYSTPYFWRVDVKGDYLVIGANTVKGNVWSFTTVGATPVVSTYDNVFTAMSLLPADLSATVTDGDNNVASVAWEVLTDDVQYPAGATATVTDTTTDLYAPTATFDTDTNGIYYVRLTVTDVDSNVGSRVAEVRVEETTCDAAKIDPAGWTANYYDRDENCIVDLSDLAVFAAEWLDDTTLTTQGTWTGAVTYVPVVNGVPNGNFETGSLYGWSYSVASVTDVPADVQEGTYAATFDGNGGVNTGQLDLPVGNHSITLWYKGDLTEVRCNFDGSTTADYTITNLAASTNVPGDYIVASGAVAAYTQYTVEFTVTTAGTGGFFLWSIEDGLGTAGFADDFRLNLNVTP